MDKTLIIDVDNLPDKKTQPPILDSQLNPSHSDTYIDINAITKKKVQLGTEEIEIISPLQNIYEIREKFAEGGQGTISRGKDRVLQRYVAIKSLKSEYFDNEEVINNFITEAKITAQLDHPSIIPLYSIHSSSIDKGLHIAMKLIHGQTLKELRKDTILLCLQYKKTKLKNIIKTNLNERLEDFLKVCDAISFAHNRNVVHRDLKPDNIMIGEFHEVYVMDWGIAVTYDEGNLPETEERSDTISGTPGYIAPEVVVGGSPTPLSDQYSLGMILFELATMKTGITGKTIEEILYKTRDAQLEPVTHRFEECPVPKDLIAIIRKATAVYPEDRYPSVEELADDIRRYLLNKELSARPDNIPRKIARWSGKHKNLVGSFILLLLLCFSGVAIYGLIQKNRAEQQSKIRAVRLVNLHSYIEGKAHLLDRYFFHIAHLLSRFAENVSSALDEDQVVNKKIYYPMDNSLKKSDLPPGSQFSKAYRRDINLYAFNYSLTPGLKFKDAELQIKKIATLQPMFLKFLINSDPEALSFRNQKAGEQKVLETGFPIKWMYVGLKNGLLINYPANNEINKGYDPRKRLWYINAKKDRFQHWSKPYIDSFGLGLVISASKSIYSNKGEFYGVVSMDMTFDYITNTLMNPQAHSASVKTRYLITKDGEIILSSRLRMHDLNEAAKNKSELEFPPFPYPKIQEYITRSPSGQFEIQKNGHTTLIAYALVKTLNWYYVEEINLDQYLK